MPVGTSTDEILKLFFFFFYLGFLPRTFMNHRTAGEGVGISLTPHYYFHPLHRHLDNSWAITAESSSLHIASSLKTMTGLTLSHGTKLTVNVRLIYFLRKS